METTDGPRYITPDALLGLRFGAGPRPTWDTAILCFRGDTGGEALVRKLNARPVGKKVLYGLEESRERPFGHEGARGGRGIVLVRRRLSGAPPPAVPGQGP